MKIKNFDFIKNDVPKEKLKQYQTLDHDEIKQYLLRLREQICSLIFRNANRKDMHIKKKQLRNILQMQELVLSMDVLLKKLEIICMQSLGDFFFCILKFIKEKNQMSDNTYSSIFFFFFLVR